jgi:hypothetical protein
MIVCANQHSGDAYRMFDPVTRKVYETRDVQWLGRMFWFQHDDSIDDGYFTIEMPECLDVPIQEERQEKDRTPEPTQTKSGRLVNRSTFLEDYETNFFSNDERNYYQNLCSKLSMCGFNREILAVGTTGTAFNNTADLKPMKDDDGIKRDDCRDWLTAVEAEHERFAKHQVLGSGSAPLYSIESKDFNVYMGDETEVKQRETSTT